MRCTQALLKPDKRPGSGTTEIRRDQKQLVHAYHVVSMKRVQQRQPLMPTLQSSQP